jgi:hypothetical protein
MSCINSKAPQAIQLMNPVALGLAANPFSQMGMTMQVPTTLLRWLSSMIGKISCISSS